MIQSLFVKGRAYDSRGSKQVRQMYAQDEHICSKKASERVERRGFPRAKDELREVNRGICAGSGSHGGDRRRQDQVTCLSLARSSSAVLEIPVGIIDQACPLGLTLRPCLCGRSMPIWTGPVGTLRISCTSCMSLALTDHR